MSIEIYGFIYSIEMKNKKLPLEPIYKKAGLALLGKPCP